jgi:hypothetical protein
LEKNDVNSGEAVVKVFPGYFYRVTVEIPRRAARILPTLTKPTCKTASQKRFYMFWFRRFGKDGFLYRVAVKNSHPGDI